ncbi:YhdP family protein [Helicobacter zhangjianzhongii]|uniref:YhdP family protein n=1 Tax=Helicobacter zhangjianzhongii TaxID=2974574 RepID=UPI0025553B01|nr:AsmA-like C-terminal domain-containing protein [Helicobacter sp. CPD2-1]MDL0080447.1 AsmA-like C-terminal domain-containing protein [Helicobacter sp. CPD2-1]
MLSIFIILFVTIFTLVGGFKILSDGIAIDKLRFADIQIRGLYLKLNNKFSLEVQELDLAKVMSKKPEKNAKPSLQPTLKEISDYVKYALWGLAYFENLRIEKIVLSDEYVASVFYDGEHYALSFPKLQAVFNVQNQGNTIELNIRKLQVFEPDVEVAGRIIYSGASGQFSFGVSLAPLLIDSGNDDTHISASKSTSKLFLQGTSDFKRLVLKAKTSKINDLRSIRTIIAQSAKDLLPALDIWLFNALRFDTIELEQASFDVALHEKQFIKSLINNTKLTLYATKPTYKLDPTLAPFSANRAKIQVENGKAVLEMIAPKLESIDLNGSTLAFAFVDSVPTLSIFATSSKLLYTKALRDLLAFYGVQIPIDRISADMQANLSINIPFADNAPLKLGGKLAAQQAILSAGGLDFVSKGASIVIDINPKAGSNFIDIWTQNTSYENLFDIDTTMRIDLSQKLLKTSLFVHSLRVSTNPEINQRLINPQDKIRQPKKQAQSALKPLESSVSLESLRLSQAMPFTPQDMLAHIAHLASNAKLDSTQSLEESATQEQDLESPSTSEQELESSTPNTPEPAQDEVVDSSDASAPTTPLAKPDASLAPTEEIIDFSSREHEDDLQDQESAHKELETLESILQDTQEQKEQEKKEGQEGQDSSKAQQEPQESKSPQDLPTPQDKNLAQDESVDSSAPSEQEPQESKIESRKYTRNGVELDFSKPMGEKEMLEKIIALIKSQDEQKFTYDIFKATRETLPQVDVEIDFSSEPVRVSIPALDVYMQISSSGIRANVVDFSKFAPFSPIMKYLGLSSGSAVVELKGARDVAFQVRIADFPTFLLSKDKTLLHTFVFNGSYKDDKLEVLSDDGKIRLDLYDNTILANFTDIDVSIDGLLASKIPAIQEAFSTSSEKKAVFTREEILLESEFLRAKRRYERQNGIKPRIIAIQAQNITGFFKDVVIPFDDFNAKIRDDRISADATYKNGIANIDIIHGNTIIKAGNFSGEFLNRVVGRHIVDGGLFELSGIYKNDMFNGDVHMQNTSFKGFAIVQNVIGLIDTIPSLVMFRSPGLSAKGYEVKQGNIKLALNTQYVGLESISLIGKSMDIQGSGFIELESQEVDMGLSISTLKNLSGILNKIPIVGYLLLGKDGKVTTQVSVRGTIQDPKTQISLAQDLLKTPLKVLKRAFTPVDIVIDEIVKSIDR